MLEARRRCWGRLGIYICFSPWGSKQPKVGSIYIYIYICIFFWGGALSRYSLYAWSHRVSKQELVGSSCPFCGWVHRVSLMPPPARGRSKAPPRPSFGARASQFGNLGSLRESVFMGRLTIPHLEGQGAWPR